VISLAVRWYLRHGLSYRDVEELLAERGIAVDHVTMYRWVQRFTPEFIEAARPCRHAPGDRWFADETYVKVAGAWTYLYRAVDQHGQVIDVLLSARRDPAAPRRFFTRACASAQSRPRSPPVRAADARCSVSCRPRAPPCQQAATPMPPHANPGLLRYQPGAPTGSAGVASKLTATLVTVRSPRAIQLSGGSARTDGSCRLTRSSCLLSQRAQ
jgi:hypothetical protein